MLIAEAYWDMEWELQQQGFDFCYDKRLYDRIIGEDASAVRDHLRADLGYQSRLLRFLENHDEPRIAAACPRRPSGPRPCPIATLPGATLWHEGQFEGRRVRPPVFLSRRPDEPPDTELADWYRRLLAAVDRSPGAGGRVAAARGRRLARQPVLPQPARLVLVPGTGDGRHLVVVNLSGQPAQGRIPLDWPDLPGRSWWLTDLLGRRCSSGTAPS